MKAMARLGFPAAMTCALVLRLGVAWAGEWKLIHQDDFARKALGTDWLILRGDWHINKDGQLQIQRQWPSHSWIKSNVPLRGKNVRVECDLVIPSDQAGMFGVFVQTTGWGGGGINDKVGVEMVGVPAEKLKEPQRDLPLSYNLLVDETHRFVMTLIDGEYEIQVDGKALDKGTVPQGRSLVNTGLSFSACPGGRVDNLKVYAAPMANPLPELNHASPAENREATVYAEKLYDASKPDCGFQEALDSLPPGGGAVILPKGTFLMRRHLEVPSHTTLMGQGPETVLQIVDATSAAIESISSEGGVHKLVLKGEHDFKKGDAFCYGRCWGHPLNTRGIGQNRLLVLEAAGNTLTVNAPPPNKKAKRIAHFFPAVCSYESEWAEVKDLQIRGPANNPAKVSGGFMTNPVTFGMCSNPRFSRLVLKDWPADGISYQGGDDGRMLDNTISGMSQGMHPGTTTLRHMAARNYAVDNRGTGLFFCWYNSNGIYYRNHLKNFSGYPDAGDVFNTIACNRLTDGMGSSVGYNGCIFGNIMPSFSVFGTTSRGAKIIAPGGRSYGLPPRYFTIALNNIAGDIRLHKFALGNVIADNWYLRRGKHFPSTVYYQVLPEPGDRPEKCIIACNRPPTPIEGLPTPIDRKGPVPTPALRGPVLDGRDYYDPQSPTCGFQKALDELGTKGGTLRLPGGRYALSEPLRVPSWVTLTGYGTGTILLPAKVDDYHPLIILEKATDAAVRDLAIEGAWRRRPESLQGLSQYPVPIYVVASNGVSLLGLDIRGWHWTAIIVENAESVVLRDCRVLRCDGGALVARDTRGLTVESSSAVQCVAGFGVVGCSEAKVLGNISALHRHRGYEIFESHGTLVAANNAHNNEIDGIRAIRSRDVVVAGNTCGGNNQSGQWAAGIYIGDKSVGTRVVYNNCGDEQLYATQLLGVIECPSARKSEIRYNVTATLATRRGHGEPSLIAKGKDSLVEANWTETIMPSNDSIDSIEWNKAHPKKK